MASYPCENDAKTLSQCPEAFRALTEGPETFREQRQTIESDGKITEIIQAVLLDLFWALPFT